MTRIPTGDRFALLKTSAFAAGILAGTDSAVLFADYTAANTFDLNPSGFTQSFAKGSGGAQQAGYGKSPGTGSLLHALLWTGYNSSYVDIHPAGFTESYILAGTISQQVGAGYGPGTSNTDNALLWNGTSTAINLNPTGYDQSYANATSGTQQVGYGEGGATSFANHALLWTGSATGFVDLNPSGFDQSYGFGISGSTQVGWGTLPKSHGNVFNNALLWTGTAASAVDLNPASGFSETYAFGAFGNQQFGLGWGSATSNNNHALIWSGTAASYVDLNPTLLPGITKSRVTASNGTQQVGFSGDPYSASPFVANGHALMWTGTADSAVNLDSLVPGSPVATYAQSIDAYGNVAGFAVYGTSPHAVEWLAGDTYKIAGGTGAWGSAANWLATTGLPASGNDVLIIASDATNRTITYTNPTPTIVLGKLTVDSTGSGSLTLSQAQDTLNTTNAYIGFIGTGSFTQTGGTHNVSGTLTLAARAGSSGTYTLSGTGTLNSPTVQINANGVFQYNGGTWNVSTLSINGGKVQLAPGASKVLMPTTLSIAGLGDAWSGQLDLANNALVIPGGGIPTRDTVANQIRQGMGLGLVVDPNHNGITSSTALSTVSTPNQDTTLGYALASDISGSPFNFEGQTVSGNDVLIKYTWKADANLDGIVNVTDLGILAGNYGKTVGMSWATGDFNSDGIVNVTDLGLLAGFYGRGVTQGSPLMSFSNALALFPQFGGSGGSGSVPEPTSLGLLALGAVGLLVRRRHRS